MNIGVVLGVQNSRTSKIRLTRKFGTVFSSVLLTSLLAIFLNFDPGKKLFKFKNWKGPFYGDFDDKYRSEIGFLALIFFLN